MSVIDARELFISSGTVNRWQPGEPYGVEELAQVLKDAIDGKPFFVGAGIVSHGTIISSYVKELFDLAALGQLRRAVEVTS